MSSSYASLVDALEKVYGKAASTGFGSAVFHGPVSAPGATDEIALQCYKGFVGPKWNSETEASWMSSWRQVYARLTGQKGDILAELAAISDPDAKRSVPLLTELIENAGAGCDAMSAAFNHKDVSKLAAYNIGDGEAMSGILVSALFADSYACSVIALMD